jgi:hypothetical protein
MMNYSMNIKFIYLIIIINQFWKNIKNKKTRPLMVLLLWRRVTLNPKPTYPMKGEVLREPHARRNHWFEISQSFYELFVSIC